MSDIFGTKENSATQAVIDAASKILMGVNDEETAKAQTEEEHPAVTHAEGKSSGCKEGEYFCTDAQKCKPIPDGMKLDGEQLVKEGKKMSSKEKMAKGLYNEKNKMDPVGAEDEDVDNDGDEDDSDKFLMKKRKAIKKAMAKEGFELPDYVVEAIEEVLAEDEDFVVESEDLNTDNAAKVVNHDCAKHVVHKEHGEGQCVPGMHTLEENEDGTGYVTHYDVMFGDKIIEDVAVEDLEIVSEMHHGHPKKKKK
jgi:hypothetical protein